MDSVHVQVVGNVQAISQGRALQTFTTREISGLPFCFFSLYSRVSGGVLGARFPESDSICVNQDWDPDLRFCERNKQSLEPDEIFKATLV